METDAFLQWSSLEVKESKCTVPYQRSGGNRWYRSNSDRDPLKSYTNLGHRFNVAGDWDQQEQEIITEYTTRLQKVDPLATD